MPKGILSMGKGLSEILNPGIKALLLKHLHEGKIHIHIVIQIRALTIAILHITGMPSYINILVYGDSPPKLCRSAIGTTYHLTSPAAKHLVTEDILGYCYFIRRERLTLCRGFSTYG